MAGPCRPVPPVHGHRRSTGTVLVGDRQSAIGNQSNPHSSIVSQTIGTRHSSLGDQQSAVCNRQSAVDSPVRRPPLLPTCERQPERSHLRAVANQQDIADEHRVIPGLALDCRETRELLVLVGGRPDQRKLTVLRQHQQQVLVGQQDELAVAVASALPPARAVFEVDAGEDAGVEAEGMALVNDEVVEMPSTRATSALCDEPIRPRRCSGDPELTSARERGDRDAPRAVVSARRWHGRPPSLPAARSACPPRVIP